MLGRFFKKPGDDMGGRVPPGQTLTTRFPVLTYGPSQHYAPQDVVVRVFGLAEEKTFTWDDLLALPQTTLTYDIHCVTHWSKLDTTWTGVRVVDLMKHIQLDPAARYVMEHSVGGYTTNLSLEDFTRPENLLAHTFGGEPLAPEHGGPLRLVVPHLYFWKSAKWLDGLEFMATDKPGFWERNGYHMRGDPFKEERYDDD
ncbi:sulfite oxidase-like oxidoreductase [Deinococcus metallilatus]|uniref:DMSO/TMAO reductase YedYZ molybdopterin-dependent catalytic subunit n=1 Tax=Deinococcus metallilatus TaxID=1211322 RepID=A0AAJ5F5F8_9DEIO|nr:sulfite oxidase-like oxidoreductase [Deinococcus metallilatus]MBB5294775.1 DMSO/TMAO reductase YedYZ molybdopterin-dependent catalytic subunit [Deinococcus metallilatus]QBY09501.1 sulfite oxidase-like oxidoreductase [Deinococcus metallilatus]RXJ09506.1 sulfite oxidase-like oxidoreductase [Deinococcus metallilatus]TLK29028.1 sulfite oxidase-like oxidoreductase [Deinococcus metallilatus]GMA16701.1 sulfite oxidase-like oxidoreductase [Deinococcus metallilatus]